MTFSMHSMSVGAFVPMLRTLSELLEKGAEHATAKTIDPSLLVNGRLAPDMLPLSKQVQLACRYAVEATARLTGREPPPFEDDEKTLAELGARIATALDYLEKTDASAFDGADDRDLEFPLIKGMVFQAKGFQVLRDWMLPHFYFHVVTAYDILRHGGVEIGKQDYLSQAGQYIRHVA
jgi:uncharacterized protein